MSASVTQVDYFAISAGIEGRANGLGYDFTEFSQHYGLSESHGRIKASQLAHIGRSSSNHRAVGESGDLTIMDEWITVQLKGYCKIVILSRFVALSVSLIQKVSPF